MHIYTQRRQRRVKNQNGVPLLLLQLLLLLLLGHYGSPSKANYHNYNKLHAVSGRIVRRQSERSGLKEKSQV